MPVSTSVIVRAALCLPLLGVAACDEVALAGDSGTLSESRGQRTCVRAVADQTKATGVTINTTIPVIEENYFVVDVPNGNSWTCITDESGRATQIAERNA